MQLLPIGSRLAAGLAVLRGASSSWWVPLFAGGETGFFYTSDKTFLFQDSAGTTPVATDGNPVGLVKDRSPRIENASQSTAGQRPTWQSNSGKPYVSFDGASQCLFTPQNPSAAITIAAAFRSVTGGGIIIGGGASAGNMRCYLGLSPTSGFLGGGWGAQNSAVITGTADLRGTNHVGVLTANASLVALWVDGVKVYEAAASGTPSASTSPLALGALNDGAVPSSFSNALIYNGMVLNRKATDVEIATITTNLTRTYQ